MQRAEATHYVPQLLDSPHSQTAGPPLFQPLSHIYRPFFSLIYGTLKMLEIQPNRSRTPVCKISRKLAFYCNFFFFSVSCLLLLLIDGWNQYVSIFFLRLQSGKKYFRKSSPFPEFLLCDPLIGPRRHDAI